MRRSLGLLTLLAACAAALGCLDERISDPSEASLAPEQRSRFRTADWYARPSELAPQDRLALWASPYSAIAGDTLDIFIHAVRAPLAVSIFRLGWYAGLGGRAVWSQQPVSARPQPACTLAASLVTCPWTHTLRVPVDPSWESGLYLIKAVDQAEGVAFYPFVVRDDRVAEFMAVVPQFTWQAYNAYGGSSFYERDSTGALGHFVSFERPYARAGGAAYALGDQESHDLRVIRWLERNGYDVTYESDLDLAGRNGPRPVPSRGVLFIGHDEYWTWGEYDQVKRLRGQGVHLVFFSGNNAYWNIRLARGPLTGRVGHVLTCYKRTADPSAFRPEDATTNFRNWPLNRPENALYGIMYQQMATDERRPLVVSDSAVGPEARAFLRAAGLVAGAEIPGAVRREGDQLVANGNTPRQLQVLFRSPIVARGPRKFPPFYYTTFFVARSGAGVFASGSNEFGAALDGFGGSPESPALQRLMVAALGWMRGHVRAH